MLNDFTEISATASDPTGYLPSPVGNWSASDTFRGLIASNAVLAHSYLAARCQLMAHVSADSTPAVCDPSKLSPPLVN